MSTMPLLWMFALNFFCFAASTRFDAPALTFLVVVFVFVRRRRDNNKELSECVCYERKKRYDDALIVVGSSFESRACKPSSGVLFKRIDITSTLRRGNFVSSVSSHSNSFNARKQDTKTRTRAKNDFDTSSQNTKERERERERIKHTQR